MFLIPGAENLITNPSVEVDLTNVVSADGGAYVTRDDTHAWSGSWAAKVNIPSGVTTFPGVIFRTASGLNKAGVEIIHARLRVWITSGQTVSRALIRVHYADATYSDSSNTVDIVGTSAWQTLGLSSISPTPGKTIDRIEIICYQTNPSTAVVYWADGADVRIGTEYGTYVDGEQGALYYWTGTAHASASRRRAENSAERRGDGGSLVVTPLLWIGDKDNNRDREISAHVLAGQIDMRNDRDVKLTFVGEVDDPTIIDPYSDYLIPVLRIQYPDGTVVNQQLGIYSIEPMPETAYETHRTGRFEARDLTWNLLQSQFEDRKSFASTQNVVTAVRNMLEAEGFTRHAIVDSAETFGKRITFKSTDSKLFIINTALNMIGYYPLHMDMDGYLKSNPYQYLSNAEPSLRLASGEGSIIVGAIEKRKNPERICNFIRVIKEDTRVPANSFDYTYINDNPSSPTSTVTLGRTIVKEIKNNNIKNIDVAETMAKREAERAASIVVNAEITTLPVPNRSIYEIYECDIDMDDGTGVLNGLVRVDGWSMGFTPQSLLVKHFVNKLEAW